MKRKTVISIISILCILILIRSCYIRTPEIRGIVIDAETKQPVEGAWVSATLEKQTRTIAGDSSSVLSIDKPHTRTDKSGKFSIPARIIWKKLPPIGFGTTVLALSIGASTVDGREAGIHYFGGKYKRDFGKGAGDLWKMLWKWSADTTLSVKHVKRTESEQFSELQALYNYCTSGRFSVEVRSVSEGCDSWELDYAIRRHEAYLDRVGYESDHAGGTLKQLGYLHRRKENYAMAIEAFKKTLEYDKKRNISFRRAEVESQIKQLEQLIRDKQFQK